MMRFRLSRDQWALITEAADEDGLLPAQWARALVLRTARNAVRDKAAKA